MFLVQEKVAVETDESRLEWWDDGVGQGTEVIKTHWAEFEEREEKGLNYSNHNKRRRVVMVRERVLEDASWTDNIFSCIYISKYEGQGRDVFEDMIFINFNKNRLMVKII